MTNGGKRMLSAVAATAMCLAALFGAAGSAQADDGRIDGVASQQVVAEDASPPVLKSTAPNEKSSPPAPAGQQNDSGATAQKPSTGDQPGGTQTPTPDASQAGSGNGTDTGNGMGNGAQQDKPAADAKKPAGTDAQDAADAAAKDGGTPTGNSGKEKQGEAGKEASKQDAEKSGANEIAPLAAGGADAPYVFWTVKDAGGSLVGGATFTIQGPRDNNYGQDSNNNRWNDNSREVTDCQTAPNACPAGNRDLDPDPGEYLVKYMSSNGTGTPISADRRYRVQQKDDPAGYTWSTSSEWRLVPGSRRTPAQGAWAASTYDFGNFPVAKVQHDLSCAAGYVYAISTAGQLQQIAPDGTITAKGSSAGQIYMNGLGIGGGGQPVYAIKRSAGGGTSQNATVWQYSDGSWSSTNASTDGLNGQNNTGTNMIGGAVNLKTGLYYFGGFTSGGNFKVYEYNPAANPKIRLKATVTTTLTSNSNGDIAFDAAGNLFIVQGIGGTTSIFSVAAADFDAVSGGTVSSSATKSVSTMSDVNGVAFDSSGKGFLGSASILRSYDQPNWNQNPSGNITSSLDSTDLATCASPPTITLEKYVEGGRVNSSDQFKLTLKQGNQVIGDTTTEGDAAGLQSQRVGPVPTVRNVALTFTEENAGTTNLAKDYISSYRCLVDGTQTTQGNGTLGSITIPSNGQSVECQFYNAPLVAQVTVHKDLADSGGNVTGPGEDWTVGAKTQATTGTATAEPAAATQQTNADGDANWKVRFGTVNDRATVSVSEIQQTGYQFDSGSCVVTHLDGTTFETALTGSDAKALGGIKPGDDVQCTYVNKTVTTLTLVKKVTNKYAEPAKPDDFKLTATQQGGGAKPFASGVSQNVQPGVYEIGETLLSGYQQDAIACKSGSNPVEVVVTGGKGKVTVPDGQNIVCTITNSGKPGSVTWEKVDDGDPGTHLSGSQWTLTGPGVPNGTVINDCATAGSCGSGAYDDQDPRPGYFQLKNQNWANGYVLKESKAPAGYERSDDEHQYSISAGKLDYAFAAAFVNKQRTPPTLPLTGGMSTDAFIAIGGVLVAMAIGAGFALRRRLLAKPANAPHGRSSQ
ncbi:MAG: LPXTG cell wall anchor domain-containing protein [Bifidobacterium subtile]|nr:LPXTG cell wall anchor domain-containing protein [Bifidobacterium subtile]